MHDQRVDMRWRHGINNTSSAIWKPGQSAGASAVLLLLLLLGD